jgi:hypothetical protein
MKPDCPKRNNLHIQAMEGQNSNTELSENNLGAGKALA